MRMVINTYLQGHCDGWWVSDVKRLALGQVTVGTQPPCLEWTFCYSRVVTKKWGIGGKNFVLWAMPGMWQWPLISSWQVREWTNGCSAQICPPQADSQEHCAASYLSFFFFFFLAMQTLCWGTQASLVAASRLSSLTTVWTCIPLH